MYQRRRQAEDSKQLLYDEDDIREHINKVNIEGGGEEDNVCFYLFYILNILPYSNLLKSLRP